jgi:hypothetical protein
MSPSEPPHHLVVMKQSPSNQELSEKKKNNQLQLLNTPNVQSGASSSNSLAVAFKAKPT